MNNNITEIVCVLDRSGSMSSILDDAIGGFNAFLKEQKSISNSTAYLTVALFDDKYSLLHKHVNIQDVPEIDNNTYTPRGMTALNDAIGKTINQLTIRLMSLANEDKPNNIIVLILTDGHENASKEFTQADIKNLISEKEKSDWQFIYLAANQDAFETSRLLGISKGNTLNFATTANDLNSNSRVYKWAEDNSNTSFSGSNRGDIKDVYANLSARLTNLRTGVTDFKDDFFSDTSSDKTVD